MLNRLLRTALTAAALTLLLVACSPVDEQEFNLFDDARLQPLNSKQSGEMRNMVLGIGRVHSAASAAAGLSGDVSVNDAIVQEMKIKIQKPNCATTYKNEPSLVGNQDVELKVEGSACPLTALRSISSTTGNPGKINLRTNFSITDSSLKSKNDVISLTLTGNGNSQIVDEGNGKRLQIRVTGNAQSATKGTIRIAADFTSDVRVSGQIENVQTKHLLLIEFPSAQNQPPFSAQLQGNIAISSGISQSNYTLNGVEIPEVEFNEYLRQLGLDLE